MHGARESLFCGCRREPHLGKQASQSLLACVDGCARVKIQLVIALILPFASAIFLDIVFAIPRFFTHPRVRIQTVDDGFE